MSDPGFDAGHDEHDHALLPGQGHHHRRRLRGCLPVLIAVAVLAVGVIVGGRWALDEISGRLGAAPDYPGPGRGQVLYEVSEGASSAEIGRDLKAAGVVKSVDAFTIAADQDERSRGIQVGYYRLKEEMKAADALAVLVDPDNMVQSAVTVPEGLRVVDVVELLVKQTRFGKAKFDKALADPEALGLPAYARGNPEGYLFPATYAFKPNDTPASMLRQMVDRWRTAAENADLEAASGRLGYSPAEVMTVASLVEAEGRGDDMGKIARVIYNRLEGDETNGLLQVDAAVNYAHQRDLGVALSKADLKIDSPYNTYKNPGLPPTPIEAPGDAAIEAATNPTPGPWFYYVTVNLRTGETKFAETYKQFLRHKAEYQKYCETSEAC